MYKEVEGYYQTHGHLRITVGYSTVDGQKLGKWIHHQRTDHKSGELALERAAQLEKIGMAWTKDSWEERYGLAKEYYERYGHVNIPRTYIN